MATLPEIGAKAANGSNAIPEAGSSWPSWPRASDPPSIAYASEHNFLKIILDCLERILLEGLDVVGLEGSP